MARQEMLHHGQLSIDGEDPVFGELWFCDGTAVLYLQPANSIVGPMREAAPGLDLHGRLVVAGVVGGAAAEWTAWVPEQVVGYWRDTEVELTDGPVTGLVTMTNHKVTVAANGHSVQLPGAKLRVTGGRNAVIEQPGGPDLAVTLPKPGCGCGGGK